MASALYETTVTLPTNGHLYGSDGPVDVTLRAMTGREEKMLFGTTGNDDKINEILQACIVSPQGMSVDDLINDDLHFLLLKLRIHTYGSDYKIEVTCPLCNEITKMTINMDDFPVYELDENFEEPILVELPVSHDMLECKLLRVKDVNFVRNLAKKLSRKGSANPEELGYIMRTAKSIKTVNGKEMDFGPAQKYVEDLIGKDSAYLRWALNEKEIGYDTTVVVESCPHCGGSYEIPMPFGAEFFRPTFD